MCIYPFPGRLSSPSKQSPGSAFRLPCVASLLRIRRLTRSGLIGSSLESDGAAIIVGRVVVVDIAVVVDINKVRGITRCG